ncbi:MAG: DegQ family serine endoprotease [Gammaproteobacteria bacterium]|nr:DegQ family serine endoprotease [Gammaproteobacteria bacterium]
MLGKGLKLRPRVAISVWAFAAFWLVSAQAGDLPDFTKLVEKNAPAVVNISTVQKSVSGNSNPHRGEGRDRPRRGPEAPDGGPLDDWFKRFFGEEGEGGGGPGGPGGGDPREARSLGSGFVLSEDGYVLTNNHVIADADKIIVRLNDRRELEAEVIGVDERSDLALLHVKATKLPVVKIGQSRDLKPGEWVLAIGSPFGFDYSVTAGIVSALGRSLPRENYVPFIQTDVAINPGNSGGPLFNLKGEVIGINSQIYSRTGGYMGVSFAIPIDMAMNVVDQIKSKGRVTRGWLGVLIQDVTRELAESFKMDRPQGALVAKVLPNSPGEKAGIQVGDVIVKFNGVDIVDSSELPPLVGVTTIDKKVPVDIIRGGKSERLSVVIGELPPEDDIKLSSGSGTVEDDRLGIVVADLTAEMRQRMEQGTEGGVLVQQVNNGAAAKAGVRRGDVIMMINNENITDAKQYKNLIKKLPTDKSIPILIHRRGGPVFLALKIPK